MSEAAGGERLNTLRTAIEAAVRRSLGSEAFRRSVDAAVERALDTDDFRQSVKAAVEQFLSDARLEARQSSVAKEIERAVVWPVRQAVAEAVGFEQLAKGTPEPLLAAEHAGRSIGIAIEAALREAWSQREGL